MRYEVLWGPIAIQQLAAIWLAAADRNAVTAAADWLDRWLARIPLQLGEPRTSSVHRVAYRDPIGVEYEVIEDDKRVIVQGVFLAP
jgi:plasmid stabilization system protein ParE